MSDSNAEIQSLVGFSYHQPLPPPLHPLWFFLLAILLELTDQAISLQICSTAITIILQNEVCPVLHKSYVLCDLPLLV